MTTDLTTLTDKEILGLTIIGEARGEPIEGQVAVGCVIRNRLHNHPARYRNYYDVCLEDKQFSCWNVSDVNYAMLMDLAQKMINGQDVSDSYFKQCLYVASGIVDLIIIDNTHNATNYMTSELFYSANKPKWAAKSINVKTLGNQVFFNA